MVQKKEGDKLELVGVGDSFPKFCFQGNNAIALKRTEDNIGCIRILVEISKERRKTMMERQERTTDKMLY